LQSLVRKIDFKNLVERGRRIKASPWLLINYDKNSLGSLRLGCTLGRKVGSAVIRNRIRRWSREWFRKNEVAIGVDINLFFLEAKKQGFYKTIKHEELDLILENAYAKIRQNFK
jgi:ribonuclease P protein component